MRTNRHALNKGVWILYREIIQREHPVEGLNHPNNLQHRVSRYTQV